MMCPSLAQMLVTHSSMPCEVLPWCCNIAEHPFRSAGYRGSHQLFLQICLEFVCMYHYFNTCNHVRRVDFISPVRVICQYLWLIDWLIDVPRINLSYFKFQNFKYFWQNLGTSFAFVCDCHCVCSINQSEVLVDNSNRRYKIYPWDTERSDSSRPGERSSECGPGGATHHIITCDRALITSYLLIDNTVHSTGQRFPL